MSISPAEQKQIVEKAKHYLSLLGSDFDNKRNIAAMAMAIGWKMGTNNKKKGFDDCVEIGYQMSIEADLIATMVGSGIILAMKTDTIEEAFLSDENEEAA